MNKVSFKMTISKIISIKVGSVLSGMIDDGKIEVGDKVEFENQEGKQELEIVGISNNDEKKRVSHAEKGQNVALLIKVKQCEEIGLEEGMSIYISEESDEDYFNDLFGDLEDEEVVDYEEVNHEENEEHEENCLQNENAIRVVIVYSDKLESISVGETYMEDIEIIRGMPIKNWFMETKDRSGWRGLIREIREMVDDENIDLNFEFRGPQESKRIFEECISEFGLGNKADGMSKEVIAKNNLKEAEKAEHRGLHEKAFDYYLKAAELGELPEAQYKIGEYYYDFCEGKDKLEFDLTEEEAIGKAMEYYEKAANQGNANAQYQLYTIFYDGYYVDEDEEEAFKWGMKAANQGMKEAEYAIGDAYRFGELGEENDEEAIKWYERAAEHGLAEARTTLGDIYERGGLNVQKNYKKSFEYYMQAAKEGVMSRLTSIADAYMKGRGVEKNEDKGIECYIKAADNGSVEAQYILGRHYETKEKNMQEAVKWYTKAAENGAAVAQYILGRYYEEKEKNIPQAVEWYMRATENGHMDAKLRMRSHYAKEMIEWYKKEALNGNEEAERKIIECYKYGRGVTKNKEEAFKWELKRAERGDAESQEEVAILYWEGNGVERNKEEAEKWMRKAAAQGNESAISFINMVLKR